jgi:hypothetical protein
MALKCPDCGVSVLSLIAHACGRGKSSDGRRDEAHPVEATAKPPRSSERPRAAAPVQLPRAEVASRPSEAKPKFDRDDYHRKYMKDYMAKRRRRLAEQRSKGESK